MNLKYKILAVLAAGIALTACGSPGTAASTPASSAVPASSHVAEEGVTEPINMLTWTLDDLDRRIRSPLFRRRSPPVCRMAA